LGDLTGSNKGGKNISESKLKGRRKVGRPEIVEDVERLYEGGM
jgi:hypothetical protein